MEQEKLFRNYVEWCRKEGKEPSEEKSVLDFIKHTEEEKRNELKKSKEKEKKYLIEKQRAMFQYMCDYVGVNVEYKEEFFSGIDAMIRAIISSAEIVNTQERRKNVIEKIFKEEN